MHSGGGGGGGGGGGYYGMVKFVLHLATPSHPPLLPILLSSIDVSKASGPDGIGARMLKSTAASIAPAVTNLFNLSLRLGRVPSEWKSARVTPVPKSSKFSDPANYRPVSLLSILSKLLEKHANPLIRPS